MFPEAHPLHEAVSWLLLAALWWLFYWPYRSYRVDDARHRLFVIRDRLFDAAADGASIRFGDRAYGMTRMTINGMLRNLGDYGVFRLVSIVWRHSRDEHLRAMCAQYGQAFEGAVRELAPEGQRLVIETIMHAERVFIEYVFRTSLLTYLLYFAFRLCRPVWALSKFVRGLYRDRVKPVLDFESNIAGHDRRSASYLVDVGPAA